MDDIMAEGEEMEEYVMFSEADTPGARAHEFSLSSDGRVKVDEVLRMFQATSFGVKRTQGDQVIWRTLEAREIDGLSKAKFLAGSAHLVHVVRTGVPASSSAPGRRDDHSRDFLNSVSKPFDFEIEDSREGLQRMINEELTCKLPVFDDLYQGLASDPVWRQRLISHLDFWCPAFATNLTSALQRKPLPSEASEALCQMLWDALVVTTLLDLTETSGQSGIYINRNTRDISGSSKSNTRPDFFFIMCGLLILKMEEKPAGSSLARPANELVDKLVEYDPVYFGTFDKNWLLGAATSASTIAFYALNRFSKRQHLIAGPFNANNINGKYFVLKCTYNIWRYALTVQKNRGTFSELIPFPGVIWSITYDGIERNIQFRQTTATKVIYPFSHHVMQGYSRIEYLTEAYRKEGDTMCGIVWAEKGPNVRGDRYTVNMHPVGVERKPVDEVELRHAIRQVLLGLGVLHSRGLVHRDVRWRNILRCSFHGWFLIDLETVWKADEIPLCRLKVWDGGIPFREDAYTRQCDLWLVGKLCEEFCFPDSKDFNAFKTMLLGLTPESTMDVSSVLNVSWLQDAL